MKLLKLFFLFFLSINLLFSQSAGEQKKVSDKDLQAKVKQEKELNRQLEEIAKSLKKEEDALLATQKKILELNLRIGEQQKRVGATKSELDDLVAKNKELAQNKKKIEEAIAKLIAQEFSYTLIIDNGYLESIEGLMTDEILTRINKNINSEFDKHKEDFINTNKKIEQYTKRISDIQTSIKNHEKQKDTLVALENSKTKIIADIEKEKKEYTKKLKNVTAQKEELQKTLASLKIIKEEKKVVDKKVVVPTTDEKIRQIGSSYQASKVKKYTGAKTIAPLAKYTLVQKFGDYVDPVYNIKIFNESVVLRSAKENDEVRSVLDGKVIFAKETQLLKNVIIIENANGIHTIYAHLSRIAPTIKVGNKVKKGYVVGRVDRELTFEVTQKNYHINPMELIAK